ncbi:hypothetical protein D3C81_997730 [compost metagenome]
MGRKAARFRRGKKQTYPLPCRPFPKHTPAACFPLRLLWQHSSLSASLLINDTALTGRNGICTRLACFGGCTWGTFACAGTCIVRRSVNPCTAATQLFDSSQVEAPPKVLCDVEDGPRSTPRYPFPRRHPDPGHRLRAMRGHCGASGLATAAQIAGFDPDDDLDA